MMTSKPCARCGRDIATVRHVRTTLLWHYTFCSTDCRRATIDTETPDRFWALVDKGPHPQGCWIYKGRINVRRGGYGTFDAWKLTNGSTRGMHVCHSCDNPPCVNPAHLWLGTAADNLNDMVAKRREPRGENRGAAKLTEEIVKEIRRLYSPRGHGTSQCALGRRFGVSHETIKAIVTRRTWSHVS